MAGGGSREQTASLIARISVAGGHCDGIIVGGDIWWWLASRVGGTVRLVSDAAKSREEETEYVNGEFV